MRACSQVRTELGPRADPPGPASGAILDHVALAPARQHAQPETRDLAVPEEVFGGAGLERVDEAFGNLGHGGPVFGGVLSPLHSAKARATVNDHSDIACKNEVVRVSAWAELHVGELNLVGAANRIRGCAVSPLRAITFQLAEVAVTGPMVRAILAAIRCLRAPPSCA